MEAMIFFLGIEANYWIKNHLFHNHATQLKLLYIYKELFGSNENKERSHC